MSPLKKPRRLKSEPADAPSRPATVQEERRRVDTRLHKLFDQGEPVDKGALVPIDPRAPHFQVSPPSATSVFGPDPTWVQYPFKALGTELTLPENKTSQPATPPQRQAPPPPPQAETRPRARTHHHAQSHRENKQKKVSVTGHESVPPKTATVVHTTAIRKGAEAQTQAHALGQSKSSQGDSRPVLALLLIVVSGILAIVGFTHSHHEGAPTSSAAHRAAPSELEKYRDNIEYHRTMTGTKLNRERIEAEIETSRPLLNPAPQTNPAALKRNDLSGVPILPEGHHRQSSRDRTMPTDPNRVESEIATTLQNEAEAQEWEQRERAQYVKDFVANAAAQGYRVKLDKNLNVIQVDRMPQSEREPSFYVPEGLPTNTHPGRGAAQ